MSDITLDDLLASLGRLQASGTPAAAPVTTPAPAEAGVTAGVNAAPTPTPRVAAADLSPQDRRLLAEALYGGAANPSPQGRQAVLDVIRNRARMSAMSVGDVINAPHRFEAMDNRYRRAHAPVAAPLQAPTAPVGPQTAPAYGPSPTPPFAPNGGSGPFIDPRTGRPY